jgi:NAD(P)-dependent dehydrogenase (short-subunit alcohol dehydrogenase family)
MERLFNKTVLITGGAQGIGRETTVLLAKNGAKVIITDINVEIGNELKTSLVESGYDIDFFKLDVSSSQEWSSLTKNLNSKNISIDILINNAGIVDVTGILNTSEKIWDNVLDINAKGTFLGMKNIIPMMLEKGSGSIVNISSMWGIVGAGGALAYQASKGAVRTMSKSVATEHACNGIRVNSVHPGIIKTDMVLKNTPNKIRQHIVNNTPMGREGNPEEVADLILFLASDESSYITGTEITIDGGFTAI